MRSPKQTKYHTTENDACSLGLVSTHTLAPRQVGEIEEQLTSARRELARSEEANQKLQRDVKEVRLKRVSVAVISLVLPEIWNSLLW